jgi:hypothetical protein
MDHKLDPFMNSSITPILLLTALICLTTINTFRMWRGKDGLALRPLSTSYRKTSQCKRFLAINATSTFVWWSFALMTLAAFGLHHETARAVRVLLFVPFVIGLALFVATLVVGLTIFFNGKPLRIIPPQFRGAAVKKWIDESKGHSGS